MTSERSNSYQRNAFYSFPRNITSDKTGYEFLGKISIETFNLKGRTIYFDFNETQRFEVNLCSPLAALINDLRERSNDVILYGFEYGIEKVLRQNGFYQLVDENYKPDDFYYSTIIDFQKFRTDETLIFQEYINKQLLGYNDFPKLSELLKKHINKSILEIFNNAHIHGGCDFVFTCGEYFPREKRLKFTISDLGLTIRKNVNLYFKSGSAIDGKDALSWAVQEGNTTRTGSIPGGLGLSLIRDFIKKNEGAIQIVSSNGYWEEKNGVILASNIKSRFLGTIVNLEFNLRDVKSYILKSEVNKNNVL